ncbi:MAG: InlB B-repeat-containing protein, partial [Clostridia bacterium]|nr:InlB B-repeat-containing protein [Clostridia bacterium]
NGGTTANPATITKQYGAKLGTLPTTSKEGYIFKGWFTSQTGGSQITADTTMPINGATYYAHWEEEPDEEYIDLSQYQVDENKKYIEKISPKTNYQEFMNSIPTNMEVRINNKHDNDIIKTGDKLIVTGDNEEKEYTLIVAGDVNKDGLTEIRDIFAINSYRRKKGQLEEICIKAGDVNEDRQTDIKDIFKINSYRRGKIKDI